MLLGAGDEAAFVAGDFLTGAAVEGFVDEAAADSFTVVGGSFTFVEFINNLQVPFVGVLLTFALHFLFYISAVNKRKEFGLTGMAIQEALSSDSAAIG